MMTTRLHSKLAWCAKTWWRSTETAWEPVAHPDELRRELVQLADACTLMSHDEALKQVALDLVIGYRFDIFMRQLKTEMKVESLRHPTPSAVILASNTDT
jgi:hypothetical protein